MRNIFFPHYLSGEPDKHAKADMPHDAAQEL